MSSNTTITNTLETEPIGKLLFKYATPAVVGTLVNSLYHIIDSFFISRGVGTLAIAGLGLTFPVMNLSIAFGTLVGMGAATQISICLGKKDKQSAEKILGNAFSLTLIISVVFTTVMLYFLEDVLRLFGGSKDTIPYAKDFMQVILAGNVINTMSFSFNNIMRASGYPTKAMLSMIIGAVMNVILAPIFIYGFGAGIRGAAIATVISMTVTAVWVMSHFFKRNSLVRFRRNTFQLRLNIVKSILAIGVSPFLMNLAACLVVIVLNVSLKKYGGDMAIGAYGGIINRLSMLIIMAIIGLNQGMQPIAGYNYGAKHYDRVKKVLVLTIKVATITTGFGFLIFQTMPNFLSNVFTPDKALIEIASNGLRISSLAFAFIGFQIVTSNFFQSIGMVSKSIFLSLSRQFLFLIPCLLILPSYWGLNGIWYSLFTSDMLASIVTGFMLYFQMKTFGKRIEN